MTSPRHLHHSPHDLRSGLQASWRTARLRAVAWSEELPAERALSDATVLAAWLTSQQRASYARALRAGNDPEEFVQRLADERRVALEEGADPVPGEVESAAAAEKAAQQSPLRIFETLLLVTALGGAVWMAVLGFREEVAAVLPVAGTVAVLLAAAALVGATATRWRDRAILSWAVSRPGQLGRGIPVRRRLQRQSVGPALVLALGPTLLLGAGVVVTFVSAALLLVELLSRNDDSMTTLALWGLGGGMLAFVIAVVLGRWRGRRLELTIRRAAAVEWMGPEHP